MKKETAGLVILDLDNTLVNKNKVFEKAQKEMIEIIKGEKASKEDMRILREMDSILIKKHESHLYPFEILALSLWFYYHKGFDIEKSISEAIKIFHDSEEHKKMKEALALARRAARTHNKILENTPAELFHGVKEVLQELKDKGFTLILLSEGNSLLQKKTLETHGLERYFQDIVLCDQKDEQCFLDIKKRWLKSNKGKAKIYVVGDGIERDIVPGNEIGAITIWKPGDYDPGTPSPGKKQPNYAINEIESLLNIVG